MEIAKTILAQLGGNRFVAMTGAKHLLATEKGLQFKLPMGKATCIVVELDPCDTYTVKAYKGRGLSMKEVSSQSDVYCDQLQDVFTSLTGLYTTF